MSDVAVGEQCSLKNQSVTGCVGATKRSWIAVKVGLILSPCYEQDATKYWTALCNQVFDLIRICILAKKNSIKLLKNMWFKFFRVFPCGQVSSTCQIPFQIGWSIMLDLQAPRTVLPGLAKRSRIWLQRRWNFSVKIERVYVFLHSDSRYQQRTAVFCKNSDSVQLIIICYFIVLLSEIESGNGMNHE